MADVTLKKDYEVGAGNVFVSIAIGEGQHGTSSVSLDGKSLVIASGPIGKLFVGKGKDLKGKALRIRSVVNDVSARTNRMSMTFKFEGGTGGPFTAKGNVENEGDLLIFESVFSFT